MTAKPAVLRSLSAPGRKSRAPEMLDGDTLTARLASPRPRQSRWRRVPLDILLSCGLVLLAGGFAVQQYFDAVPVVASPAMKAELPEAAATIKPAALTVAPIDEKTLEMVSPALGQSETGLALPHGVSIVIEKPGSRAEVRTATIKELQQTAHDAPDDPAAAARLGAALAKQGDLEAAIEAFHRAAALEPDNIRYIYDLASVMDRLGRGREAAYYYGEVLEYAGPSETADDIPIGAVKARLAFLTRP